MPSVSIEFPILQKVTAFGAIPDALIPAVLKSRLGPLPLQFILDTGADFTMLPHHMAELVGVDLKQAPSGRSLGIEGKGVKTWLGRIEVTIGPYPVPPPMPFFFQRRDTVSDGSGRSLFGLLYHL